MNPLAHPVGRMLYRLLALPSRLRFRWNNRKRYAVSESAVRAIAARIEEAQRAGSKNYEAIFNAGLFVALLERDLGAYRDLLFFANTVWHQQFAARGLALLLFEAADDLPDLLGKKLRARMIDVGLETSWLQRLDEIVREFEAFHKQHSAFLHRVRNFVGAHRDHRALRQLETLDSLDGQGVLALAADFSVPLKKFFDLQTDLMHYANHPGAMLKEAARLVDQKMKRK